MRLSISNLEKLSGVPVHTIRIWERRYGALSPMRSAGNTRFYTDEQLKRLLNIVSLNQAGVKISQACALSTAEINLFLEKEIETLSASDTSFEYYIAQMLQHAIDYNEIKFSALLSACLNSCGVLETYTKVLLPLLQRVGLMWRMDRFCAGQEHFLTQIIRQKLMVAIDQLPSTTNIKSTWLLFLPAQEMHDIPLLFAKYLLRSYGFHVIYLGENVPLQSLEEISKTHSINQILLFLVRQQPIGDANTYLSDLKALFPHTNLHLAGNSKLIAQLELSENMTWFQSISEFQNLIRPADHVD